MRKGLIVIVCSLFCVLSGCQNPRIIEEVGIADMLSFDAADDAMLLVGASIPKVDPEAVVKRIVLSAISDSPQESRLKMSGMSNRTLVPGQLRVTLFSKEIAQRGLFDQLDALMRDPFVGQRIRIAITKEKAFDILKKDYPQHPPTGRYINDLLEEQANANVVPISNLHLFVRDYYDDGIDPVAPILKDVGESIEVDGIALFHEDRFVAAVEPLKGVLLAMLRDEMKEGEMFIRLPRGDKEMITFSTIKSKRKVKVRQSTAAESGIAVEVEVRVQGSIREYVGNQYDLSREEDLRQMERDIGQFIKKESEALIRMMQEHQADSIGIGQYVRNRMNYHEWKKLKWKEVYHDVKVTVSPSVKIRDVGKLN